MRAESYFLTPFLSSFLSFFLSFLSFKMSFWPLTLPLPMSYTMPEQLKSTTPEQNELILTTGLHALNAALTDAAGHSDKSLKQRMEEQFRRSKAADDGKHLEETKRLASQIQALEKQLASSKASESVAVSGRNAAATSLAQAVADAEKRTRDSVADQMHRMEQDREAAKKLLSEERIRATTEREKLLAEKDQSEANVLKRTQASTAEQIRSLGQESARYAADLKAQREAAATERETLLGQQRAMCDKLVAQEREVREKLVAQEREAREKFVAQEREATERLAAQAAEARLREADERKKFEKREEDLRSELNRALGIKASSVLKGAANEGVMTDILQRSFGGDVRPKEFHSGDSIFTWETYTILNEFKAGHEKGLPKPEIEKAYSDFVLHRECELMMLICTDGPIPGHTKHTNFDIGIYDGRPVIYISRLNEKDDKVLYLQSLQPVIRELIKLVKKAAASGLDAIDALEGKLSKIRMQLKRHEAQIAKMRKSAKTYAGIQKKAWDSLKHEIDVTETSFSLILDDDTDSDTDEVDETDERVEIGAGTEAEPASVHTSEHASASAPAAPLASGGAGVIVGTAVEVSIAPKKRVTTCRACGQLGHIKSSKCCTMKK